MCDSVEAEVGDSAANDAKFVNTTSSGQHDRGAKCRQVSAALSSGSTVDLSRKFVDDQMSIRARGTATET